MRTFVFFLTFIFVFQSNAHTTEYGTINDLKMGGVLVDSTGFNSFKIWEGHSNYFSENFVFDFMHNNGHGQLSLGPPFFGAQKEPLQGMVSIPLRTQFHVEAYFYNVALDYLVPPRAASKAPRKSTFGADLLSLLPNVHVPSTDHYDGTAYSSQTSKLFAKDTYLQKLMSSKIKEADAFLERREFRKGIELYKRILDIGQNWAVDKNILFDATRALGNVYVLRKQYDSAMIYQRSAFVLAEKLQLGVDKKIDAYRDIGITFGEMGRDEASLETYKKTIEIALAECSGIRSLGVLYLLVAGCYEKLEFYDTMGYYLDKYKKLGIMSFDDADLEFHRLSSVFHKVKGEYELALKDLEQMNTINDSLYTLNLSDKVLTLTKQDKMQTNEKESVLLQRKNTHKIETRVKAKNKRISYLKSLMIGLSVIALFVFIALYKNRKLTRKLAQMNDTIHTQRNEIATSLDIEKDLNKKLHTSNSTLEHFFSIIAHDLRSPYNVMLGYADMLVDNYDLLKPTEIKDCLSTLRRKAYKNYQLTQNLLSWAMMQKDGIIVNKRESNVRKVIQSSLSLHKELADKKGISLINNCSTNLVGFLDKDIAASVLSNLVNNALKFTNKCGSVTISAKKMGENILFKIDDTGLGMCKKTRKNLFNLNKISSKPGTAAEPGAGLGLILCQELVATHEGAIRVKSKLGKGTTVLALL